MKVAYDEDTDTLTIVLKDAPVAESDEDKPGVILDFDAAGDMVGLEILDASTRVTDPRRVELAGVMPPTYGRWPLAARRPSVRLIATIQIGSSARNGDTAAPRREKSGGDVAASTDQLVAPPRSLDEHRKRNDRSIGKRRARTRPDPRHLRVPPPTLTRRPPDGTLPRRTG